MGFADHELHDGRVAQVRDIACKETTLNFIIQGANTPLRVRGATKKCQSMAAATCNRGTKVPLRRLLRFHTYRIYALSMLLSIFTTQAYYSRSPL